MDEALPDRPKKGRGAVSNRSGRYEAHERVAVDDGWAATEEDDWEESRLPTRVTPDTSRTVIARNESPDVPFERSIKSHAWLGLSPGLDFETRLFAKPNAAALLEQELAKPRYRPRVIALGTNTDPYQPVERERRITREILEVLSRARHPVTIVTKSALVVRDLDILAPMAEARLARVMVSVTTLDKTLARKMEPRAPGSRRSTTASWRPSSRPPRRPARGPPATCCCACRARSRSSSRSGWRPTSRIAGPTSSTSCARRAAASSTTPPGTGA
jgi:hypothetical protein